MRNSKGQFVAKYKTKARDSLREYASYSNAKQRCYNKKCDHYYRYGARGIKMCQRWLDSFDNFLEDMGKCPEGMSLDRINSDGDYCPENCRWADSITQATNRSMTRFFEYNGERLTIPEISRRYGIKRSTLSMRIYKYKWTVQEAVEIPVCGRRIVVSQ